MSESQQHSHRSRDDDAQDADAVPAEQDAASTDDFDDLLDEIDDVLETNAAEFVRSFVQKGGQ